MKLNVNKLSNPTRLAPLPAVLRPRGTAAFSLIEIMMSVMIMMTMFTSLYLGFAQGFGIVQAARENLRATQVLEEKTETIRLYTWSQINDPEFIPRNFSAPFFAYGADTNKGFRYYGTMTISPSPLTYESYAADLRLVTVDVSWTNGTTRNYRQMQTLVTRRGLQNYVWF